MKSERSEKMTWISSLYETFENNSKLVGKFEENRYGEEYTLIPISHTTQTAHIELTVTENGEFHSAKILDRDERSTVIPVTEKSVSRSGSVANQRPHPLHDQIKFVAGDFVKYAGKIRNKEPFQYYIDFLEKWVKSSYATEKLKSIYKYISKKQIIEDLVRENILVLDHEGNLFDRWTRKHTKIFEERPPIFSVQQGGQFNAFVRFNVYSNTKVLTNVWQDKEMYSSFINFYNSILDDKDYCYVTGNKSLVTSMHASRIRKAGDKAKLISANDKSGFTFRGRFRESHEAASISYEVSHKAHNALKWLIQRQGTMVDNRVFLIWSNEQVDTLDLLADSLSLQATMFGEEKLKQNITYTAKDIAREFSKGLYGYQHDLDSNEKIIILLLDSATTGRMAILYYRKLNAHEYFDRLKEWHTTCFWLHRYHFDKDGNRLEFTGAPSMRDIAFAAYGDRADNRLVKGLLERMIPCVLDGRRIPQDIIRSAFNRSIYPLAMEKELWKWEKTLSITCALINKEEGLDVGLDEKITDRNYLFGRMLAVADVLERRALGTVDRPTNALRYMNSFAKHPERTWKTIQENLQPYQQKLGNQGIYFSSLLDEVASKIHYNDFNNKPLSGKFLLGFYSQRHALYQKRTEKNEGELE